MSFEFIRPTKLVWEHCRCGSKNCKLEYPLNLGQFYLGTGFNQDEKDLINRAFAALEEKEHQS